MVTAQEPGGGGSIKHCTITLDKKPSFNTVPIEDASTHKTFTLIKRTIEIPPAPSLRPNVKQQILVPIDAYDTTAIAQILNGSADQHPLVHTKRTTEGSPGREEAVKKTLGFIANLPFPIDTELREYCSINSRSWNSKDELLNTAEAIEEAKLARNHATHGGSTKTVTRARLLRAVAIFAACVNRFELGPDVERDFHRKVECLLNPWKKSKAGMAEGDEGNRIAKWEASNCEVKNAINEVVKPAFIRFMICKFESDRCNGRDIAPLMEIASKDLDILGDKEQAVIWRDKWSVGRLLNEAYPENVSWEFPEKFKGLREAMDIFGASEEEKIELNNREKRVNEILGLVMRVTEESPYWRPLPQASSLTSNTSRSTSSSSSENNKSSNNDAKLWRTLFVQGKLKDADRISIKNEIDATTPLPPPGNSRSIMTTNLIDLTKSEDWRLDLRKALREDHDIVHIAAHATKQGDQVSVELGKDDGKSAHVDTVRLAKVIVGNPREPPGEGVPRRPKIAIANFCYGSSFAETFVDAWTAKKSDDGAVLFWPGRTDSLRCSRLARKIYNELNLCDCRGATAVEDLLYHSLDDEFVDDSNNRLNFEFEMLEEETARADADADVKLRGGIEDGLPMFHMKNKKASFLSQTLQIGLVAAGAVLCATMFYKKVGRGDKKAASDWKVSKCERARIYLSALF